MTETEINQAIQEGKAEVVQPSEPNIQEDLRSSLTQLQVQLRDYIPLLERLRNEVGLKKGFVTEVLDFETTDNAPSLETGEFNTTGVLKVFIYANGLGSAGVINIRFNGDTGNNYSYRLSSNSGAFSNTTGASKIDLTVASQAYPFWCELAIFNNASIAKRIIGKAYQAPDAGAGNPIDIAAVWENTTEKIKSITVSVDGVITFEPGSRIAIWGSTI